MWLAPTQVKILPIADRHLDYAYEVKKQLEAKGMRVELDDRNEKIGYKIREARLQKVPYMLVIGDSEVEAGAVAVRKRGEDGDLGAMKTEDFIARAVEEIETKVIN